MEVRLTKSGDVLVAKPLGRWLDAQTAPDLLSELAAEIERGATRVLLDLSAVANVDSAGIGALIRLLRLVPPGGRLALASCSPNVQQLLRQSRIDQLFPSYEGKQEAIESFLEAR